MAGDAGGWGIGTQPGSPNDPLAATRTIPIPVVFGMGGDPVEAGLVASLNRPGGNLTGVVLLGAEIAAKRLELLHKSVPATESIALLEGRADSPYDQAEARNVQSAARTLGLRLLVFNITTDSEIAAAFATLVERKAGAVLVGAGAQLNARTGQIISLAGRYALPTMFFYGEAREGGHTHGNRSSVSASERAPCPRGASTASGARH
jgi:putative ABC transport system substrate-binding protein